MRFLIKTCNNKFPFYPLITNSEVFVSINFITFTDNLTPFEHIFQNNSLKIALPQQSENIKAIRKANTLIIKSYAPSLENLEQYIF